MVLRQTLLEISPPVWLHTTSCQLTFSLSDIFLEDTLSPDDNRDESPDLDCPVDLLITFVPEFSGDLRVELNHGGIPGDDGVESLLELPLMKGGLFVVVVVFELLKDFAIIGLCHTH